MEDWKAIFSNLSKRRPDSYRRRQAILPTCTIFFFCRIQYGGKNNFILRIQSWHKDSRCAIDLFVSLLDI